MSTSSGEALTRHVGRLKHRFAERALTLLLTWGELQTTEHQAPCNTACNTAWCTATLLRGCVTRFNMACRMVHHMVSCTVHRMAHHTRRWPSGYS